MEENILGSEPESGSGLLLSVETINEVTNQHSVARSDGTDADGSDASDGAD